MESWYRKYLTWKKDQSQFGNLAILIKNQALIHCIKIEVRKYIYYLKEGLKIHNWRGRSYYQIRNFYNLIIYNTLNSSRNAIKKTYQGRVTPVEKKSTFWGGAMQYFNFVVRWPTYNPHLQLCIICAIFHSRPLRLYLLYHN